MPRLDPISLFGSLQDLSWVNEDRPGILNCCCVFVNRALHGLNEVLHVILIKAALLALNKWSSYSDQIFDVIIVSDYSSFGERSQLGVQQADDIDSVKAVTAVVQGDDMILKKGGSEMTL